MTTTWDSQDAAMGMRDVIAAIADKRIDTLRPQTSYAVVQSINREQRSAQVLYMGDTDAVTVALGSIEPATVGQTVRIGGTLGHRYVEDVLGNAIMSGNDTRYAQTGHTHAGGGAISLAINDLSDVDTATNPPGASSVLGWNNVGGFWAPVSIDLGTQYLPLTGGTVTGPVTFQSSMSVGTTLNVGAALTAQSFSGVGTNITNLNASALASGTIPVGRFPTTIGSSTTGTAAAWTTGRLLTISGDMTGTVTVKGDADMTLSVALQPDSIDLGTDTTGAYVRHITGTANQIISTVVVEGEGTTPTLSLPQSIGINSIPTFMRVIYGQVTGTSPMAVSSTTRVDNLTVHYLGAVNQDAAFFQNANNLNAGNVASARLTGAYTGITGLGTLTALTVTGVAALGNASTIAGNTIWHAGNDGVGSGLDAGLLGGVLPIGYASTDIVESLMGDLLSVGLYDAAAYNNEKFSIIFDRPTHQAITGLTVAAGDNPIDFRFDIDLPVIPQIDIAANAARRVLLRTAGTFQLSVIRSGDDDYLSRTTSAVSTPHNENLILPNVFAMRMRVRKTVLTSATERVIARHGSDPGNLAWKLAILNGALIFTASSNGTTLTPITVLTAAELDAISGTANDTDFYVGLVVTRNGTNLLARGWGSTNGITWTAAALEKSVAYAFTTFYTPTTPLWIGGEAAATAWDGRIYSFDAIADSDPAGVGSPIVRFDASEHPYGGTASFVDLNGRTWTTSSAAAFVHATYVVQAIVPMSVGDRTLVSAAFSYSAGVNRPWHVRLTWNPTTDVLAVGHRPGSGLAVDAATPAFTDTTATYSGAALSTIGAVTVGEATGPSSVNWSFGGRVRRVLLSKNAATILDLVNTNVTSMNQVAVTPTTGPVMTFTLGTAATTMPKPVWVEGPTVYRHNMYWIVASSGEVDFVDSDYSGRADERDVPVVLYNGDWVIAMDPIFGAPGHEEGANLTLNQVEFQYIPFSTETFVKEQIGRHIVDRVDPHAAAGYLQAVTASSLYSPIVHTHAAEITGYINLHKTESDPHPIYLTQGEADGIYIPRGSIQPYEPQGAVLAHEQKPDPHPVYVSHAEGNAAYAVVTHGHTEFAQAGHTHPTDFEVLATDGAQSARVFMGSAAPVGPRVGDLWIQTFDILLQPPVAPSNLVVSATAPTTVTLTWNAWDPTVAQTSVQVERSPNGSTGWVNILTDNTVPYTTTVTDSGLAERTTYFYRVRAGNATGQGVWGNISAATTNAPPNAPASLSVTSVTPTSFRLNWAAVTGPANDPMHATPYEVFRNGSSLGLTASLFWDHTGLTENVSYSLGVRARDNLGVFSTTTQINASAGNADPPAPTGLSFPAYNHNSVTLSWSAISGITDFQVYQVFRDGNYVANVATTSYNFTGLAPSTTYNFQVRTVDNYNAVSGLSTLQGTTAVNPDTTPPAALTITSYQPESYYGHMVVRWNQPEATAATVVYYNVNGAGWNEAFHQPLAAGNGYAIVLGDWGAGNTIYCVIHQWDDAGNVRYGDQVAYTLVESPTNFGAHSSNSWRSTNGGQWGGQGNAKVYQGYYDTASLNNWGFWFYGKDFQNWWVGGRTITSAQIFINREGCGNNVQDTITLYVHNVEENPGNVVSYGTPTIAGGSDIGTVQYNEAKWMTIPTQWMYECMAGTRRGFAVARGNGKPYVCLRPANEGYSGAIAVSHLG